MGSREYDARRDGEVETFGEAAHRDVDADVRRLAELIGYADLLVADCGSIILSYCTHTDDRVGLGFPVHVLQRDGAFA